MATKKPKKSKVRKLTLRKETLKDLAAGARRGAADAVRGGARKVCMSCNDSCVSN
jgi:hypothetical protein